MLSLKVRYKRIRDKIDTHSAVEVERVVKKHVNIYNMLEELEVPVDGNSFIVFKAVLKERGLEVPGPEQVWTGPKRVEGPNKPGRPEKPREEIFCVSPTRKPSKRLVNRLIKDKIKKYECEKCPVGDTHQGEKINLHLHHVSGDSCDNRVENLQLLCPNCHSQIDHHWLRVIRWNKDRGVISSPPT